MPRVKTHPLFVVLQPHRWGRSRISVEFSYLPHPARATQRVGRTRRNQKMRLVTRR